MPFGWIALHEYIYEVMNSGWGGQLVCFSELYDTGMAVWLKKSKQVPTCMTITIFKLMMIDHMTGDIDTVHILEVLLSILLFSFAYSVPCSVGQLKEKKYASSIMLFITIANQNIQLS